MARHIVIQNSESIKCSNPKTQSGRLFRKEKPTCGLQETHFGAKHTNRLKVRGQKKYFMQTEMTKNRGPNTHIRQSRHYNKGHKEKLQGPQKRESPALQHSRGQLVAEQQVRMAAIVFVFIPPQHQLQINILTHSEMV